MVVDIGGTADVALLKSSITADKVGVDVLGMSRYNELAGDDFDIHLAGYLLGVYEEETNLSLDDFRKDERTYFFWELLHHAENVKKYSRTDLGNQMSR